ncbi:DNA polymerase III subunit alpha [Reinekea marinisedimentorum]|uniref:DNA polymerase III subunit alpha n=1 Tax=Reinekea marinisedimentorum TaxID=230495 RepID=A0A4R3I6D3_9GAMM|nr:DNA polymerase III subunit alpha [Reinekea marinisedimentorum]TCS40722.1 DNA polymerase-3 subunit alpha [Reinekea marinisedimentorum]
MTSFVHLRIHTEYSLIDGIVRIKPLVGAIAEGGMPAVAVTDITNFFGLVKFYNAALGAGVKPILGADLWLENPAEPREPYLMTVLACSEKGYRNLTELISDAYQTNQHDDKAIVKAEWIEQKQQGLILLSGARRGQVGQALLRGKPESAEAIAEHWQGIFGDRFYLELQRTSREKDEAIVQGSLQIARKLSIPVVATNDVMFLEREDFEAHETRVCINEGVTLEDPKRVRNYSEEQYLKSPEEMAELFSDIPEAIENTLLIAVRCSVTVELGKYYLPDYPVPEGMTMDDYFRKLSAEGLENRLKVALNPEQSDYQERRKDYFDRLEFELDIIIQMGFPGYFLIVMDFIRWGKENGVPVGPGRGSGAGSLVAWVLDITDLDPLEYDLLFERFLNPERVSMPDFDVDFCMDGRERVIQYVADTYGRQAVSQIVTFGTMAAKAVVRDVARVQGKPFGLADKLSKLIPPDPGMKLGKALDEVTELREFLKEDEEAMEIWEMALKLEGITRQTGKHAGGVVIAPTKLTDFSPLLCDEDGSGLVTQFDKNDVESAGLVKFDFLGLRTLTIIDWALKIINPRLKAEGKEEIDIARIPLDDEAAFDLLKEAKTTAVFQLESRGMKDLVNRLQPDCLEDMIALVALFRPGPLQSGMVDNFINRKHGREDISYPDAQYQHELLKPILAPTYGIILYQEQVMQIAQVLAGYTLGGADMLRRAMGKKKPEEMAKQRAVFKEGSINNGIDGNLAMKIFDLVEKFAGYGFNKSHSAAYALVSYQTLWLKTHYPAAFMAATMSSELQNTEKVVIFVEECRQINIDVLPPDVNEGEYYFTVNENNQVIYGLGAIKGVGEGPVEAIVEARKQGGPFTDLFDFCDRIDSRKVNKRAIDALIKAGALDNIGPNRTVMLTAMPDAVKAAEQQASNQAAGILDMFGELEAEQNGDVYEQYMDVCEASLKERLAGEKETLGLYLTGHPIDEFEAEVRQLVSMRLSDIEASGEELKRFRRGNVKTLAGLVLGVRTRQTQKGDTMAIVTLDDRSGRIEMTLFGEAYQQFKDRLEPDTVVVVEAELGWDDYSDRPRIRTQSLYSLEEARQKLIKGVEFRVDAGSARAFMNELQELTQSNLPEGQGCEVWIKYQNDWANGEIRLGSEHRIRLEDEMLHTLKQRFGDGGYKFRYQ